MVSSEECQKFKSFVYCGPRLEEQDDGPALVVRVQPRKNNRPVCGSVGTGWAFEDAGQPRIDPRGTGTVRSLK